MTWNVFVTTLAAYAAVAALTVAAMIGLRWRDSGRLLPIERLRPGRWSGAVVIAQFLLVEIGIVLAYGAMEGAGLFDLLLPEDAGRDRRANLSAPLALILYFVSGVAFLYYVGGSTIFDVGLGPNRWRRNVFLGGAAFLVAAPIVLGVFWACMAIFPTRAHPLEKLTKQSLAWYEWAALFAQAVIVAPVLEEWLYRGILQGWLRRTTLLGHASLVWIAVVLVAMRAYGGAPPDDLDASLRPAPLVFAVALAAIYVFGIVSVYQPIFARGLGAFLDSTEVPAPKIDAASHNFFEAEGRERRVFPWSDFHSGWWKWKRRNARWAIFGSSMLFALGHASWPDPIPLFLLGLVLGWLSDRTQSLVPSIVCHSLFNLVAFIVLSLQT